MVFFIKNKRYGKFDKIVDAVVYINCHEQAEKVVEQACKNNVAIIPYGLVHNNDFYIE